MAKSRAFIPNALRPWIEARRRFHLSHAHIQMARALGMNPKKFAKLANHLQQPWKAPLPEFITPYGQKIETIEKSGICPSRCSLARRRRAHSGSAGMEDE